MTKRILYVEDHMDTAEAVKIILSGQGYEIYIANTGKTGLEKLNKENFDLVILDIMLPDMSGWDILEKRDKNKNTKFAFLSILPVDESKRKELSKAGVLDYITKPFTKENLVKRVNRMIKFKNLNERR